MLWLKILLTSALFCSCDSSKILGVIHLPAKSHVTLTTKLLTELAKNGHEVTLITPSKQETNLTNLKQIHIEGLQDHVNLPSFETDNSFPLSFHFFMMLNYHMCERILENKKVQKLLNSTETFDAVLVHQYASLALYSFAERFKAPLILFSPIFLPTAERFLHSQIVHSSYIPNIISSHTGKMTFWQRIKNTIWDVCMIFHHTLFMFPKHRQLVYQTLPEISDLKKFYNNVSLHLMNSHMSVNAKIPYEPNMVEIGGFHIEDPKPLPPDVKNFLDNSHKGAIVFSFGSLINCADLPEDKLDAFIKVFSQLKENILWKFNPDKPLKLPENVKIMKWLPQSDVLAHPNVKALISHGGLGSVMESVYFAKPFIAIPAFADQNLNTAQAVARGYAVHVPYKEITEDKLTWALNEILNNSKYKDNVIRYSKIMRNRSKSPVDSILYWVDYIIRHRGNPYLIYSNTTEKHDSNKSIMTFIITSGIFFLILAFCSIKMFYKRR